MRHWSIATRFSISILVFTLPLVALIYYLVQASNEQVEFSSQEVRGSVILTQLGAFQSKAVGAHFTALVGGTDSSPEQKRDLMSDWEELLKIAPLNEKQKEKFHSSYKVYLDSNIEEKYIGGRFLMFNQSLSGVREAIADRYNIILDPDLDSYYAMDLLVNQLPHLQEFYLQLGQFVGGADDIMYEFQKKRLISSQSDFEKNIKSIISGLEKIRSEDEKFYGVSDRFQKNVDGYQENVREQLREVYSLIINADQTLTQPSKTFKRLSELSEHSLKLNQEINEDFDKFLEIRMAALRSHRNMQISVSIAVLLIAILISAYFGITIHRTIATFREAVKSLRGGAKLSLEVGQNLTSSSAKVSESSSTQAAAIEETSASLEELSSMVSVNAQNSVTAKGVAGEAKEHAVRGAEEMQQLILSMSQIAESSKKIEEIMQIIDDIAFQTNLLALNASVEAARAGEHGKGFAVVADAVRSLAQKSADSAKETGVLITDSLTKISMGKESADRTGEAMRAILSSVEKVTSLNQEIAGASQEQTMGIQQISKAVNELEQATIANAGTAKLSSEHSEKALYQAEELMRIVDILESELSGNIKTKDMENFDFQDAIEAHLKWKVRLKNFIQGSSKENLDSKVVCKDDQCPLGKWIYGAGASHSALASYNVLKKEHALFHKAAGDIVSQVKKGMKIDIEILEHGSEFALRTRNTVSAIGELSAEIGKKAK